MKATIAVFTFILCVSVNAFQKAVSTFTALNSFHRMPQKRSHREYTSTLKIRRNNEIEIGIRAAQLLLKPSQQKHLKQEILAKYPFIPELLLDNCIESTANSLKSLAPEELQLALTPGGIDKHRPKIRKSFVAIMAKQLKNIPVLNDKDKISLMEYLADFALDGIRDNTDNLLLAPEARLEILEKKIQDVKMEMGRRRLLLYRIRLRPAWYSAVFALCFATAYHYLSGYPFKSMVISVWRELSNYLLVFFLTLMDILKASKLSFRPLFRICAKASTMLMECLNAFYTRILSQL